MLTPRPWLAPAGRSGPLALLVVAIGAATFVAAAAGGVERPLALATLAATEAAIAAGALERVAPSGATRLRLAPAAIAVAPILGVAAAASLRAGVIELRTGVGALDAPASGALPLLAASGVGTLLGVALLLGCRPRAAIGLHVLGLVAALLAAGLAVTGVRALGLPTREAYLASLPVAGSLSPSSCDGADHEERVAAGLIEVRRVCPRASCPSDPGCYLLVRDRASAGAAVDRADPTAPGDLGPVAWSPPDQDRLFVPGIVASDPIAIRRDGARGLVLVESRAGRWAMPERLDASADAGGVHAALDERTSASPAWAACAAAGALAALASLWRAIRTRARLERAAAGHLGDDGWITFDDARPPLHAPSATGGRAPSALPAPGPVVVLFDAGGGGAPYRDRRTPGPRIVSGTFSTLETEARALAASRAAGAVAVALLAAAPLAGACAALFR